MSFAAEPPPPGPHPVLQRQRRGPLIPTLILVALFIVAVLFLASFWTEVLWFRQVGFSEIFRTQLLTKVGLFLGGGLLMAGAVLASLLVGYRSRPIYAPVSTEQASLDRYREGIEPLRRVVTAVVPIVLGLFAGSAAAGRWETFLLWVNREPFGQRDAQFGMDVGFFVFTLPWLQFTIGFLTAVVLFAGLAGVATHYLYGGLRLQGNGPRVLPAARVHLSTLAAVFLLLRAADYWVSRYALTTRDSERITGLTYTDATAVLTSRGVLAVIALIIAGLFAISAVTDRWRLLPLYGVVLLVVSAVLIGGIYPALVQRFQVKPSEQSKERTYIERNIEATRAAYGLADVEIIPYQAKTDAEAGALRKDAAAVPGVRLVDPYLVSDTFRQLEQNKQYYGFVQNLDVDKYTIDGEQRDVVIAVRELDAGEESRERNWFNDHIVYTHGFGIVGAYGNQRARDGKPVFFESGIPSRGELGEYEPRVYFGERSPEYSIVGAPEGASPVELDFPDDREQSGQKNTIYTGDGGVDIGSAWNRLLYAVKFREQNILLSNAVNSESQIMYHRQPRERVQRVAPFLTLDQDPYPAVVNGRIVWIVDGYTTTDKYPYSRTQLLDASIADSLTVQQNLALQSQRVNYMRNSVKATVDAYDGTVTLYAWDEQDPILKAWRKVFPDAVEPRSEISGELMAHLRYPEDLFKVQRNLLQRYHVAQGDAFFSEQGFWRVPNDPTLEENSIPQLQPPYYLTVAMPGDEAAADRPRFSLTSSFIPAGGRRGVLTGFLAVDADAGAEAGRPREGYGKLRLLQLPQETVVQGPSQVQAAFKGDATVSQQLNLLRTGGGSSVIHGNLLTLPMGGGLLYVQPIYVRGNVENSYPLLQRVLVSFGQEIGFAETLEEALDQVFQGDSGAPPTDEVAEGDGREGDGTSSPTRSPEASPSPDATPPAEEQPGEGEPGEEAPPAGDAQARLNEALQDAAAALRDSDTALKAGDFAAYGEAQDRLQAALERAIAAEADLGR